jgi:hypothetical protein
MPWIARDKDGTNPYRLFGARPRKLKMVSYDGDVLESSTWSVHDPSGRPKVPAKYAIAAKATDTYGPLANTENTTIDPKDCPAELLPGEGPFEVRLELVGI